MKARTRQGFGQFLPRVSGLGVGLQSALYAPQNKPYGGSWPLVVTGDTNLVYVARSSMLWRGHRYAAPVGTLSAGGWGTYLPNGGMGSNWNTMTLAALCEFTAWGGSHGVYVANAPGGGFPCPSLAQYCGAGTNEFGVTLRAGSGTYYSVSTGDTTPRPRMAIARIRSDDKMDLWVDGAYIGQTAIARGGFNTAYTRSDFLTAYGAQYVKVAFAGVWNRWLSDSEVSRLSLDPFALFADPDPLDNLLPVAVSAGQFARPATPDGTNTGWLPSSGSNLYAMIDETPSSSADYIYTRDPDAMFEVPLSSVTDPAVGTGHVVRFKAYSPYSQRVRLCLYDGTTLIAEWTDTLTAGEALYEHTLTSGEANSITGSSYAGGLKLRGYGVRP